METAKKDDERKTPFIGVVLSVSLLLILSGCAQRTVVLPRSRPMEHHRDYPEVVREQPAPTTAKPEVTREGAGAPLFKKAQNYIANNEYKQAELVLERALRIEPKNGYYWYTLARAKFGQKQYGKTVQLCLKSKSLAGGDSTLIRLNDLLMEKAQ